MRERFSCQSFQNVRLKKEHRKLILDLAHQKAKDTLGKENQIRFEFLERVNLDVWPAMGCQDFLIAIAPKEYDRMAIIDIVRGIQEIALKAFRQGVHTCIIGPGTKHSTVIAALNRSDSRNQRFDPERDSIVLSCAFGYESIYKPLALRLIPLATRKLLLLSDLFFTDEEMILRCLLLMNIDQSLKHVALLHCL